MFRVLCTALMTTMALSAGTGCADRSPPPPRAEIPREGTEIVVRQYDPVKPMPSAHTSTDVPPPPFDDPALVDQEVPERAAFLSTYNTVGRPVFLVVIDTPDASADDRSLQLQFTEWLRSGGRVTMLDPMGMKGDQADVVVHFNVNPPPKEKDSAMRLTARAVNARDGLLLAQAMVDMPTPADRQSVNRYTRFLARKLMDGITQTWLSAPPPDRRPAEPLGGATTRPSDQAIPPSPR